MKLLYKFATFIFAILDKVRAGYYTHIYSGQVFLHKSVLLGRYSALFISPGNIKPKIYIDENTRFKKFCTITLDATGEIRIGKNVFFNNYCSISCLGQINIGNDTLFGEGIKMYDHNHIFNKQDILVENQGFKIGSITIGNNCWIGSNVVILNNVSIGDNVVVGAGCIISNSVPANTIVKCQQSQIISEINFR